MRPHDLPLTEHFQQLPCGSRAKYMGARCRCMLCRAANSRYETSRAAARQNGDWNGLVSVDRARAHLRKLSRRGIGRRAVSAACDVPPSILQAIKTGSKTQIRARTERKILSVTAAAIADAALVPAGPTLTRLQRLLLEGFTKTELARRLGSQAKTPALQVTPGFVLARTEAKVEKFYHRIMR